MGVSVLPVSRGDVSERSHKTSVRNATCMYAFQLVRKMSLTFCLCSDASDGRVRSGSWILAARPPDRHASATIDLRSDQDTMATLG